MSRSLPLVFAVALVGCQSVEPALGTTQQEVVVCPGASTVEGIDVSEFQGNVDWAKVKASGRQFAIIRVSDGTGHLDSTFAQNWAGAKNAGLIRGVYQFFEPGGDAVAQANLLLSKIGGALGPDDLPPMIDVEVTGSQTPATVNSKIHQWIDKVQAATGKKPLIYTGTWFWDPNVNSSDFASYPLVESYYCSNCCPNLPKPWSKWTMWQYSSTGSVPGISGNVDLDKFDGTLAQLQAIAGGAPYSADYVSQSWPLASTSLKMKTGETVAAELTMRNSGEKSWDANTKLGTTQPRDRASVFADASWPAANRAAHVTGTVAPGASFKFAFKLHAPDKPGSYHEFFDLVQEGAAWFSDPGQGGPPDNQLEAWIEVTQPAYSGAFVAQSYPAADKSPVMVGMGQTVDGWIDLKNTGAQPWKAGVTKLAPTPRDQASPLDGGDWLSPTRVSTLAADVAPGAVGRFALPISGTAVGDYTQSFALLEEGVTWFSDAANGGGPADNFIKVHVVVTAEPQTPPSDDGGAVADMGGDTGDNGDPGAGGNADDPGASGMPQPSTKHGCSMASHGDARAALPLVLLIGAALFLRRRRISG
jgi:lysozyme